jgi:uncharacterized membrane protein YhaH (DUF805 family)
MNFFDAVKTCFVKYTNFSGRASRSEFWLFVLFTFVVSLMLVFLDPLIAGVPFIDYDEIFAPLSTIFTIAIFIPSIAVNVRRLHDVNRSGWWLLIELTVIGILLILFWCCTRGDEGENRFGPKPIV